MDEASLSVFRELFAERADQIVVRRWLLPAREDTYYGLPSPLRAESPAGEVAQIDAILGLPVADHGFLGPMPLLQGSRFFSSDDAQEIVLPAGTADALGLDSEDLGQARVSFNGHGFTLVGILDDERFRAMQDLNNRPLLPIKDIVRAAGFGGEVKKGQKELEANLKVDPTAQESGVFYVDTSALMVLPVETARKLGAEPFSVSVRFGDDESIWPAMDKIMTATRARFYLSSRQPFTIGTGSKRTTPAGVYYVGSGYRTSIGGLSRLIIPIIIAGTIILNTMLGSVYERKSEIAVYNAIGLNPTHIGLFFLAEAFVYGVLGSVGGYLIGQLLSLAIVKFDLIQGINLNFSSLSVVYVILFTITVVLLSTLYPAVVATRAAVPSGKRKWALPETDGHNMAIVFPFIYQPSLACGVLAYLEEYFARFSEASVGDLIASLDQRTLGKDSDGYETYAISCTLALAPFDLGVTQRAEFRVTFDSIVQSYRVHLQITRLSGQDTNWTTTNKPFLEKLRQYLMHWRNLPTAKHEFYAGQARTLFAEEQPGTEQEAAPECVQG